MNSSVSLIITGHNQQEYLRQLLDFIKSHEEFEAVEIIVVDSSDIPFSSPPLNNLYSVPNRGPSAARNFGASKATNEWIIFCDADDFVSPAIFGQIGLFAAETADAVFFKFKRVDDSLINSEVEAFYKLHQQPESLNLARISGPLFFIENFFPVHAVLFRRTMFEKVKFNEAQWFIEDVRLYLELALVPGVHLKCCTNNMFQSFHRDYKHVQSLSGSNDTLYWQGVGSNYSYLAKNAKLSTGQKIKLVKCVAQVYHVVDKELKVIFTEGNKKIWNYFLGLPRILKNKILFKTMSRLLKVVK